MKIEDAKMILTGYGRLKSQIKDLALSKLREKYTTSAVKGKKSGLFHLRYLVLGSIYAENDYIVVSFYYDEPYSGSEEVIIRAEDLEG